MPAEKADQEDLEPVIGFFIGAITRAFSVRFLSRHEVIEET